MKIVAYCYDADMHCLCCTIAAHGGDDENIRGNLSIAIDREGNPICPVFDTDEEPEGGLFCGDCHAQIG